MLELWGSWPQIPEVPYSFEAKLGQQDSFQAIPSLRQGQGKRGQGQGKWQREWRACHQPVHLLLIAFAGGVYKWGRSQYVEWLATGVAGWLATGNGRGHYVGCGRAAWRHGGGVAGRHR